ATRRALTSACLGKTHQGIRQSICVFERLKDQQLSRPAFVPETRTEMPSCVTDFRTQPSSCNTVMSQRSFRGTVARQNRPADSVPYEDQPFGIRRNVERTTQRSRLRCRTS